jgi:hypothetical protein
LRSLLGLTARQAVTFDKVLYDKVLTQADRVKHTFYANLNFSTWDSHAEALVQNLTRDDVKHLVRAEDELMRSKKSKRIFPTTSSPKYFKLFKPTYHDLLLTAWEYKYGERRTAGWKVLRERSESIFEIGLPPFPFRNEAKR